MKRRGLRVYIKFFDFCFLNKLILKLKKLAADNNVFIKGPISLPTRIERYNILRSPHVNKKSRDQLEIRTHKRIIDFFTINENFILKLKNIFFYFSVDFIFKIIF